MRQLVFRIFLQENNQESLAFNKKSFQQDVCVLSAAVATGVGVSAQGLPARGMSAQDVSLPGGCVCACLPGSISRGCWARGYMSRGCVSQHALDGDVPQYMLGYMHPLLPVDRMRDSCENITLPQLCFGR